MQMNLPSYLIAHLEPRSRLLGLSQQALIKRILNDYIARGIILEEEK